MKKELYLEPLSESAREEISYLYKLGVEIEELEYLIMVKMKESLEET